MRTVGTLLAIGALLAAAAPASAAPNDLDRGFGEGGMRFNGNILIGLGEEGTSFGELRLLPDGRIVAITSERCSMACRSTLVARYTPAGGPDPTFGSRFLPGPARFVVTDGDGILRGSGLAVRPDGGLVVGTQSPDAPPELHSVPPDGVSPPIVATLSEVHRPEAVLPDGRVVATAGRRITVLRPDLAPDPAFRGGAGLVIPKGMDQLLDVVATSRAVLVAGTRAAGGVLLWRVPLDGARTAMAHAPLPRPANSRRFEVQPQGRVVLGPSGRALVTATITWSDPTGRTQFRTAVAAFRPDGGADRRFGRRAVSVQPPGTRAALQRDGRAVLVAEQIGADSGGRSRLVVRRLDVRGRPDASFPRTRLDTVANMFFNVDVALDRRGRILIAGGAFTTYGSSGLLLVRLKGATG